MNKQQLEKLFDERFMHTNWFNQNKINQKTIKDFIFQIAIPEVLKSVLPDYKFEKKEGIGTKDLIW